MSQTTAVFLKSMIPTKKQFKNWSLPNKYALISIIFAAISIILTIFGLYLTIISESPIKSTIALSEQPSTFAPTNDDPGNSIQSAFDYLNEYDGDGFVKYSHLNLSQYPKLKQALESVNANRVEYNRRSLDIRVLQDNLESGNIRLALEASRQIIEKQANRKAMLQ